MNFSDYENSLMAHRYLYYVIGELVISDFIYDQLEVEARKVLPMTSPIQGIGSSLSSSYSEGQIALANKYLSE